MSRLCLRRYFKPAEVREENPTLSTLPWPARPVGPDAHAQNKVIEAEQLERTGKRKWRNKWEAIFSMIGYTVGMSSIWRFPYFAFRNKGGAFLIPYLMFTVLLCLPVSYIEIALGQFSSLNMIKVWRISPFFKGIGYVGLVVMGLGMIYYNVIIAWSMVYLFASMTSELPWTTCGNFWNTAACSTGNFTGTQYLGFVGPMPLKRAPADEFWMHRVLGQSKGIDVSGTVRWEILLCLILVWIIVFLAIFKGIRSTGKLVYVTAVFPFLALAVLLIRSFTLPGALDGVAYFFTPDWDAFASSMAWGDAIQYALYTTGIGAGPLINLGSYGKFHNNCQRDILIVFSASVLSDIMSGLAVFSILGFLSHDMGVGIEHVTFSGPGVAFVSFSTGLAKLPMAPLWGVIFFLMVFMLGIDSAFGTMNVIVTVLVQEFRCLKGRRVWVAAASCIVIGAISISLTTQSSIYWVNLMDYHSGRYPLIITALLEVVVIMYIYGYTRFADDLYVMLGSYPSWFWTVLWNFVTPITLLGLLIGTLATHKAVSFDDYVYPEWAELVGWLMAGASLIFLPIAMVAASYSTIRKQEWNFRQFWRPKSSWGPALNVHRELRGGTATADGETYQYATVAEVQRNKAKRRFRLPRLNFGRRSGTPLPSPEVVSVPDRENVLVIPTNQSIGSSPPAYPGLGRPLYPDLQNTRFSSSGSMSISNPEMFQNNIPPHNAPQNTWHGPPPPPQVINPVQMDPGYQGNVATNQQMPPINLNITLVQGDQHQGDGNQGNTQQPTTQQQITIPANQQQLNIPTNQQPLSIPTTTNQIPHMQANQPILISGNQLPSAQEQLTAFGANHEHITTVVPHHDHAHHIHHTGITRPVSSHEQLPHQHVVLPAATEPQFANFSPTNQAMMTPVHHVITTAQAGTRPVVPPIHLGDTLPGYRGNSLLREMPLMLPAPPIATFRHDVQPGYHHHLGYM